MISKFVKTRNAYVNALESINDDRAFHIGRYTGILQKQNESLRQENETLRSANEDLLKENRTLKNFKNIDVEHPSNKFF